MDQISPRLARALEKAKLLPIAEQDAAAAVIEGLAALDEARRSEFASDAEVADVLARHGL